MGGFASYFCKQVGLLGADDGGGDDVDKKTLPKKFKRWWGWSKNHEGVGVSVPDSLSFNYNCFLEKYILCELLYICFIHTVGFFHLQFRQIYPFPSILGGR